MTSNTLDPELCGSRERRRLPIGNAVRVGEVIYLPLFVGTFQVLVDLGDLSSSLVCLDCFWLPASNPASHFSRINYSDLIPHVLSPRVTSGYRTDNKEHTREQRWNVNAPGLS